MSNIVYRIIAIAIFFVSPIALAELSAQGLKTFKNAQDVYVKGKYDQCLKILTTLNSTDLKSEKAQRLKSFCKSAKEYMRDSHSDYGMTPQQEEVASEIVDCRIKLQNTATKKKMKACLKKALKIDPENPQVVADIMWAIEQEQARKAHSKK